MRWARFECEGKISYGIVEDDTVEVVEGDPFDGHRRTRTRHALEAITWLPPVVPPTFYCVGLNYAEHLKSSAARRGEEPVFPDKPDVGYRAANALVGHEAPIVLPPDATERVQYEGELVCVIGRMAKHLTRDDALDCLLGFTVGNDVSERTWQKSDRTLWRAKNTDTFKPMGPWIETDVDLDAARTRIRLNGRQVIEFETNNMLFGVVDYLVAITRYITLYPGDVLWMGTEGEAENLRPGDEVEIEITGIGSLRNPVVAAGTSATA
jgi:2-keto-4-pentenoate hydratase/2-oxohepta-3-ene-1,7-dioic acid hydratase in catechol pathway